MYTKSNTDIMLFCLVLGDAMCRAFLVKVSSDMFVSELRKTIWEEKKNFFNDNKIDADQLKLWKVDISMEGKILSKIHAEDEAIREQLVDEKQLNPLLPVGHYFDDEVAFSDQLPNNIRIVIQPDYVTGQKRHAYPEPELEPKRQKTLFETFNFDGFVDKLSTEVNVVSLPELYPINKQGIAGRFRKQESCIPISGQDFPDMRLNDENITEMGKKLVELYKNKERAFQLLYAVSGAGKTRAIFDMALNENGIFVTYIECRPSSGEKSIILEPTLDRNFAQLVKLIENTFRRVNIESARAEAERLIILEYTARVLYLIILSKKFEDLTPRDYLLAQIDGGQNCIADIKIRLNSFEYSELDTIIRFALKYLERNLLDKVGQKSLVFAIDEANVASTKILNGQFLNRQKTPRGLLTPMLEILNLFEVSMVIAGTAFSLKQGENVQSDIGKVQDAEYLVDFKFMESEDVKTYITQYLDLLGCDTDKIGNWKYLTGRPRLTARLVFEVILAEQNLETETKQAVLEYAVDKTINVVRKAMETHLGDVVNEAYRKKDISTKSLREVLENLFVNCRFFGGYVSKSEMDDELSKLVDCGIALLEKSNSKKYVVVNEPLAVEVVNTVLSLNYNSPTEALMNRLLYELNRYVCAADFDMSNTAKGLAWQYLVLGKLIDFNGKTVYDFVNEIYRDQSQLPDWTKDAVIEIKSYGSKRILSMLDNALEDVKDDVDVVEKILWGLTSNYLLVPSTAMRPDGLYIGKCNSWNTKTYWTLLLSAKLYSENLSGDKVETDKRSTDLNLAYYEKNGKKVNCPKLKTKLDNVRNRFDHRGSLRIHFIYPGIASSQNGKNRGCCNVEENDVIMYIDESLLDHYFSSNYIDQLKDILNYNK